MQGTKLPDKQESGRKRAIRRVKRALKGDYQSRESIEEELSVLEKWRQKLIDWPAQTLVDNRVKFDKLTILEDSISKCKLALHLEDLDEILWDKEVAGDDGG